MDSIRSPKRRRIDDDASPSIASQRSSTPVSHRPPLKHRFQRKNSRGNSTPHASTYTSTPDRDGAETNQSDAGELDRDWYAGQEDGTALGDDFHNPFGGNDASWLQQEQEVALAEKRNNRRMNPRAMQRQRDNDAWETNRMLQSGVAQRREHFAEVEEDEDRRVHLITHDLRPDFLKGHTVFTKQLEPVSAVKDSTSDMAVFSRKGSRVVKERRQQKERQKQAQDATNASGTTLGNIMGVAEEDMDTAAPTAADDNASDSKFAKHFKDKSEGSSNFSKTKTIQQQRQFLPAFAVREEVLRVIRDNQVTVVVGQTGSGKTTQLTQFLLEDEYGSRGLIGCTQPRRVAAMSVAKRVSEEMDVALGGLVGYAIRFEDCTSRETKIKYMTEGVLLRECLTEPDLDKYSCIIMDEAHERTVNTDVLLGLFKKVLARRRDLKLIVTSATMNAKRFSEFFGGAPEFTIPGRTFAVDIQYSRSPCEDYVDSAVRQALAIHVSQGPGDILIFMTGQEDIEVTCEILAERLTQLNDPPKLSILPIYSQMPADLQAKIFDKAPPGVRKCIVATNIAETSLTVDGIMYVVDAGFSKLKVYNPRVGMDSLQMTPVSQASAGQRAGRAGRTGPGRAFHLYTERAYKEEFYVQTIPEIQRTNLANTVLLLKSLRVDNLLEFDFLDSPPQEAITTALFDLWALGALDNMGRLTKLGEKMSSFPIDPAMSKMILTAADPQYDCAADMLTIVSMLSVQNVFYRPKERLEEAEAAHERFAVPESDHLTLMNVFKQWQGVGERSDRWATKFFLHAKSLRRAAETRAQLEDAAKKERLTLNACGADWDPLRKSICAGYYHQAAVARGITEFSILRTRVGVQLHPTSALNAKGVLPEFVVYHELVLTSKEYMSCVTAVDPMWLADLGGVFYSAKEKTYDAKDATVRENQWSRKEEIEANMAKDRQLEAQKLDEEERKRAEKLAKANGHDAVRVGAGKTAKKVVSSGVVKKPMVKRGGRGF
ncbi:MAG: hypothetical protein Q9162_000802 [Coniocarpon cinnabarinum]